MRVLFTDDVEYAKAPVYLSKKKNRFWRMQDDPDEQFAQRMRNVVEWTFPDWETPVSRVPPEFAGDVQFFAADVLVSPRILRNGYDWRDINAGFLEIEFDGVDVEVLGTPPADKIARRRLRMLEERDAHFVSAKVVQANEILWKAGDESAPCVVLITFDRGAPRRLLAELARLMMDLKGTNPPKRDLRFMAELVTDESYYYHERNRLPKSVTEGVEVYAAGLWLHRPFLRDGRLRMSYGAEDPVRDLPCLATPGDRGGIELIPFDEVDSYRKEFG